MLKWFHFKILLSYKQIYFFYFYFLKLEYLTWTRFMCWNLIRTNWRSIKTSNNNNDYSAISLWNHFLYFLNAFEVTSLYFKLRAVSLSSNEPRCLAVAKLSKSRQAWSNFTGSKLSELFLRSNEFETLKLF